MRMEAYDFFKEAAIGLALIALAIATLQIDARSVLRLERPSVLPLEKAAPICKPEDGNALTSDQMCKANFKKILRRP